MVGVDQSLSSTGISYRGGSGHPVTSTVKTDKLRAQHRLAYVRNRLLDVVRSVKPSLVVFEDYVMGFRKSTGRLAHLGELGGVLKLAIWEEGIDVMIVSSATLKSVIAGNGKADKTQVMAALRKQYGYHADQEDEADALALMLIGEHRCGSEEIKASAIRTAAISRCDFVPGQPKLALKSIAKTRS